MRTGPKAFRVYVEAQHELETPAPMRGGGRFDILSCLNNMSKRFRGGLLKRLTLQKVRLCRVRVHIVSCPQMV